MTATAHTDDLSPDPWERQPDETTKAYEAFAMYRDQGARRSVRAVARESNKHVTLIGRWSSAHHWVERAAAFDADTQRQEIEAWQKQRRDSARRRAKLGQALQDKAAARLQTIDLDVINATQVAQLAREGARLEREAFGEPDRLEITGADGGPIEHAALSAEERRARAAELRRLAAERRAAMPMIERAIREVRSDAE
ncbi:unannotated protein [freshwater metagenome]|uniref:Unannotated protein n=1 Tax=freshwater metagenome TaxID=449393 RepID=A0A6J7H8W8_9ZZZZ|nr:hypothetical protein [Actinomycetota bacterium]